MTLGAYGRQPAGTVGPAPLDRGIEGRQTRPGTNGLGNRERESSRPADGLSTTVKAATYAARQGQGSG